MTSVDRSRGQVVVEVLLILPIFLFLVFTIMEIGHLAYRTLLIHHAAYEVARIGSLTSFPKGQLCGGPGGSAAIVNESKLQGVLNQILKNATVEAQAQATLTDPQSACPNEDLVVTVEQSVLLVFPLTGVALGTPLGAQERKISAIVRMPIEKPLFQ